MPYERTDPIHINRIRRAGLGRVRERALASGVTPERLERDVAILRVVANGTPAQAAERFGVHRFTVDKVVKKYGAFALEILEEQHG